MDLLSKVGRDLALARVTFSPKSMNIMYMENGPAFSLQIAIQVLSEMSTLFGNSSLDQLPCRGPRNRKSPKNPRSRTWAPTGSPCPCLFRPKHGLLPGQGHLNGIRVFNQQLNTCLFLSLCLSLFRYLSIYKSIHLSIYIPASLQSTNPPLQSICHLSTHTRGMILEASVGHDLGTWEGGGLASVSQPSARAAPGGAGL